MFGEAPFHSFTPHFKRAFFHVATHKINDRGLSQTVLQANHLKGRSVFPRHLDQTRPVGLSQVRSQVHAIAPEPAPEPMLFTWSQIFSEAKKSFSSSQYVFSYS